MTKFHLPSFSTPANSRDYVSNWEKVFGRKKKAPKAKEPGEPDVNTEETDEDESPSDD